MQYVLDLEKKIVNQIIDGSYVFDQDGINYLKRRFAKAEMLGPHGKLIDVNEVIAKHSAEANNYGNVVLQDVLNADTVLGEYRRNY